MSLFKMNPEVADPQSQTVNLGLSVLNNVLDVLIFVSLIVIFKNKSLKHAFHSASSNPVEAKCAKIL